MEKIMHQQQPVKYEKHTEIFENDCETGGILCRPTRKKIIKIKQKKRKNTMRKYCASGKFFKPTHYIVFNDIIMPIKSQRA